VNINKLIPSPTPQTRMVDGWDKMDANKDVP